MNFLTVLLEGAPVLTQTADKAANESLNIIDLAMKGGWIMVVLALLSVVGAYIFFERFMALRKSMEKDGRLNDRVKDNLMENDVKSAYNYCQKLNTPVSRMLAKGVKDFNLDSPSIRQALENTAALEIANRGYVIENGRIVYADTAENLSNNDAIRKSYLGIG